MHRRLCHGLKDCRLFLFPSLRQSSTENQELRTVISLSGLRESCTQAPQGAEGLLGIVQELADDVFKLQGTCSHPNVGMHLVYHGGNLLQALRHMLIDLLNVHHHRVHTSLREM